MLKRFLSLILIALVGFAPLPASAIKYKGDLEANESLTLPEQVATPVNPSLGKRKLYFKQDGAAYSLDSSGNENPIDKAGFKNHLINGGFRLWQRGTSFTSSNSYGADRWKHAYGDGAGTTSRQSFALGQTDVPGEPRYYWRHDRTTAASATSTVIRQRIEGVRTLAGITATWSVYGKCSLAKNFNLFIFQNFGTGGSPSSIVVTGPTAFNCTTSWSRHQFVFNIPSLSGKTVGTDGNDYVEIVLQESGSFSTFTLDLAQVQVEKGSVATPFQYRPVATELNLAQRYYCKTYNYETSPGTPTSAGYVEGGASGLVNGSHAIRVHWSFPVRMRAAPFVTTYSLNGTSGKWTDASNTDRTGIAQRTGQLGTNVEVSLTSTGDLRVGGHMTADAEL
jgi:hypothetical protein